MRLTLVALLAGLSSAAAFGCRAPAHAARRAAVPHRAASSAMAANQKPPPISGSFYRRPAKALERGGGFYVPGFEGDRLRLALSALFSAAIITNHLASAQPVPAPQQSSEVIGLALAVYTVVQALVERATASAATRALEARDAQTDALAAALAAEPAPGARAAGQSAAASEFAWAARATLDSTRAEAVVLVTAADGEVVDACVRPSASAPQLGQLAAPLLARCCATARGASAPGVAAAADGAALLAALGGASGGARSALVVAAGPARALVASAAREGAFTAEDAAWLESIGARVAAAGEYN
jgi:hypothetical protein